MENEQQSREGLLGRTFVKLADSLVSGFDVVEMLDDLVNSAVTLLDVAEAGLMLTDQRGFLRVVAASSERTRTIELLELQNDEGPCLECFRTGRAVASVDLDDRAQRWPQFASQIADDAIGPVYALPMRLRNETVGAMNLFLAPGPGLAPADIELGQALSDVATIAIISHRAMRAGEQLAEQLQLALSSRVAIEQAKGVLSERAQIDMQAAFELLRSYARTNRQRLSDVAAAVASGELPTSVFVSPEADT
jgi:GAF domain-containing protein